MQENHKILLTGAAGFIGSYFLGFLNKQGYRDIIIVDDFSDEDKWFNFDSKHFTAKVERSELFDWLKKENPPVDLVFHLGARNDTTEFDYSIHEELNVEYSKNIRNYCIEKNLPAGRQGIPLIYASSAATYGSGEFGFKDDHDILEKLRPLNPYGVSKNEFDKWIISDAKSPLWGAGGPPFWAGLKFFNVYGSNEYHKGRMASMIFHGFNQIQKTGKIKLFKSHRPDFEDGQQLRDFIYVEDVAKVMYWMMKETLTPFGRRRLAEGDADPSPQGGEGGIPPLATRLTPLASGLYNLGTGKARTFEDLAKATFAGMNLKPVIEYIDMPEDILDKYQYFTEADMTKLRNAGYTDEFCSLEEGVKDYVANFLLPKRYY